MAVSGASAGIARFAGDPSALPPRWSRMLRSAVLLAVGLAIAFSATLHRELAFDVAMTSAGLGVIGAVHLVESAQRRRVGAAAGSAISLFLGIASLLATLLVFVFRSELALVVVLAAWALVGALLEFIGMVVYPGSRQDAPILGFIGLLLALLVLVSHADLVAVIGFFGGYAVIAGVFLGIAALDRRGAGDPGGDPAPASPLPAESER